MIAVGVVVVDVMVVGVTVVVVTPSDLVVVVVVPVVMVFWLLSHFTPSLNSQFPGSFNSYL